MLGVVVADNLELIQLDVKLAFLHDDQPDSTHADYPAWGYIRDSKTVKNVVRKQE